MPPEPVSQIELDKLPKSGWSSQKHSKPLSRATLQNFALIVASLAGLAGLGYLATVAIEANREARKIPVRASQYGDDWPFQFETGLLVCVKESIDGIVRPVVTLEGGYQVWALNGPALGARKFTDHRMLLPRDPITGAATKGTATIKDLIEKAQKACY